MSVQSSTQLEHAPSVVDTPTRASAPEPRLKGTLHVVTRILRQTAVPMSVREIVEHGGADLPTRSKTPMTVVARDLAMDIKNKGDASAFIRTSPGRFTLRELVAQQESSVPSERDVSAVHAVFTQLPRIERANDNVQHG